mmetsp:Transcript_13123/g.30660  ORF Transcript_13123/g.30660 Transcript_13123/m.30660 type:complete len:85 (+) Transcript_13123:96-350(+)
MDLLNGMMGGDAADAMDDTFDEGRLMAHVYAGDWNAVLADVAENPEAAINALEHAGVDVPSPYDEMIREHSDAISRGCGSCVIS